MRVGSQCNAGARALRRGIVVACAALCVSAAAPEPPELTLYAAASLRDALQAAAPACERESGSRLVFNFGASNDLARQILAANKADVFFSADEAWMDQVVEAGLVDSGSRRPLLSNRLVVVGAREGGPEIHGAADLAGTGIRRLSLANPEAVPAGKYAKAWLQKAGVWEAVAERVLPGLDARAALAAVESGGAEAGIVYRTDAAISGKVRVLYEVPEADGPAISYPIAALGERPALETSRRLVACLAGDAAAEVFRRLGFVVVKDSQRAP
jgi:molybdate transport system substrate-binding protein